MANAAKEAAKARPVRCMLVGLPGAGKTGSLACLANAGFKLRVLDYDGNMDPLFKYVKPECLGNIDFVKLEDKLRGGAHTIEVSGLPTAFADGLRLLDKWVYKDEDGEEVDLGRSKEWGPDTIVVVDSLTGMGRAAMRRALAMVNRDRRSRQRGDWGIAIDEQDEFLEKLTSSFNHHHVIVLAHMKMVGPKEMESKDDPITKQIKEQIAELIETRYFPNALGRGLPQTVGEHFPTLLQMEQEVKGGKTYRWLHTVSKPELDLKCPAADELPSKLPIEDGMLTVFEKLTGGIEKCLQPQPASKESTDA